VDQTSALEKFETDINLTKEVGLNFQMAISMPLAIAEDIESRIVTLSENLKD